MKSRNIFDARSIGDVTRAICYLQLVSNLSRGWHLLLIGEFLLAAQQKYCETSCKSDYVTLQWLENENLILRREMILATKLLREFRIARHATLCNFTCNLCRYKIARQVA